MAVNWPSQCFVSKYSIVPRHPHSVSSALHLQGSVTLLHTWCLPCLMSTLAIRFTVRNTILRLSGSNETLYLFLPPSFISLQCCYYRYRSCLKSLQTLDAIPHFVVLTSVPLLHIVVLTLQQLCYLLE